MPETGPSLCEEQDIVLSNGTQHHVRECARHALCAAQGILPDSGTCEHRLQGTSKGYFQDGPTDQQDASVRYTRPMDSEQGKGQ
jgi:hypothetical protein